ncbi:MAG: Undecaprenyl-diphosphatase [bacterium]|nr:Undecaprenyl-diphosphatase [bacterium]
MRPTRKELYWEGMANSIGVILVHPCFPFKWRLFWVRNKISMNPAISPVEALILGVVEGLTEFLPVSSTGHLILAAAWLGIDTQDPDVKRGVDAFEVVIQSGALLAVIGHYRATMASLIFGLLGKDRVGRNLLFHLILAFLPAAVIGVFSADWIKEHLFGVWPVVAALAAGGVLMVGVERHRLHKTPAPGTEGQAGLTLGAMTARAAVLIGFAQCVAMWPGTSRSMMTIVAALLLGFSPRAAAEFSFLLAIPTLGGATVHDLVKDGHTILEVTGAVGLGLGFAAACISAWVAVTGFLSYLNRHGMAVFGWYRIALAAVIVLGS